MDTLWINGVKKAAVVSHGEGVLQWCHFESDYFLDYYNRGMSTYDAWVEEMYRMEQE